MDAAGLDASRRGRVALAGEASVLRGEASHLRGDPGRVEDPAGSEGGPDGVGAHSGRDLGCFHLAKRVSGLDRGGLLRGRGGSLSG